MSTRLRGTEILVVLGQRRRNDRCGAARGELDGEAADTAGGADDEQHICVGELERVDGRDCGDPGKPRGACCVEVDAVWRVCDRKLLGDGDELCPGAVVDGGVGVQD